MKSESGFSLAIASQPLAEEKKQKLWSFFFTFALINCYQMALLNITLV